MNKLRTPMLMFFVLLALFAAAISMQVTAFITISSTISNGTVDAIYASVEKTRMFFFTSIILFIIIIILSVTELAYIHHLAKSLRKPGKKGQLRKRYSRKNLHQQVSH